VTINLIVFTRTTPADLTAMRAIGDLNVIDGWREFQDEIFERWPEALRGRSGQAVEQTTTASQREEMLASADAVLLGYPYPKHILSRMPRLRWVHLAGAGVSSLAGSEWWASAVLTTSSRGHTNAALIGETVMAGVYALAKGLDVAALNSKARNFKLDSYRMPRQIAGKTMGVLGAGGIGRSAARLARAAGMRAIGLRRSVEGTAEPDEDFDLVFGPRGMHDMLAETDFLVIAAMLTEETRSLVGGAELASLRDDAFVINVARGEIVDETALAAALASGTIAGAYLDVWTDDMASPPIRELLDAPNVIFTPHIAGRSENPGRSSIEFFQNNLRRYLAGEPLENVVDWTRGY
jgi:phosphoglycerate dehydrogenase-like enzyme